ncbi:hypothetical protein VTJ04DRAFT_455 [Mycothermus thermophilus]|uniref:uncharacterized protein n=1 Tax=Humicola insolens TaxID=85995 RepID=UPI003742E6E9
MVFQQRLWGRCEQIQPRQAGPRVLQQWTHSARLSVSTFLPSAGDVPCQSQVWRDSRLHKRVAPFTTPIHHHHHHQGVAHPQSTPAPHLKDRELEARDSALAPINTHTTVAARKPTAHVTTEIGASFPPPPRRRNGDHAAMAAADVVLPDMDEAISPRQPAPSIEPAIQPVSPIDPPIPRLDLRADPDAQAAVSDFLDFTEYLPADITRSLTLIGNLNNTYQEESAQVHELTAAWARLPSSSHPDKSTASVDLRAAISDHVRHAVNLRAFSLAEARRMTENVNRHYARARTILAKLETILENYPPPEEQKSPTAVAKSPQASRPQKSRGDGQRVRRPRVPRITVPGEVLAPYELDYGAYTSSSESGSEDEREKGKKEESAGRKTTPAPQTTRIKVVRQQQQQSRTPKPARQPRARTSVPPPNPETANLSTSAVIAKLGPPPENPVIGGPDAPWCQLTEYELAKLRKRMKKNASWTPSDTMVARELNALGRGVEAFRAAKLKAEQEGRPFEGEMPVPSLDPATGEMRLPPGALTVEAFTSEDKALSNRGMKLNEAKKLKREMLAKLAAEEAEESARKFDAIARTLMSDSAAGAAAVPEPAKPAGKSKAPRKRKRDSVPETEAEKPESGEGVSQRVQIKRTKTETPVPPPVLTPSGSQLTLETSAPPRPAGVLQSTTPIPVPIPGQDQSITARSVTSAASGTSPAGSAMAIVPPIRVPTETPIPPPVISPRKSTTPILPPVRETRKTQATRVQEQQQPQQPEVRAAAQTTAAASRSASRSLTPKPDTDHAATTTTTASTTSTSRRPTSRGKATSTEPQPGLAADRPRRASTARNTPAPEAGGVAGSAGTAAGAGGGTAAAAKPAGSRRQKRAPGVVSKTIGGGNSAVGTRKAAPRKKSAGGSGRKSSSKAAAAAAAAAVAGDGGEMAEVEVDDEGNIIDPDEERYCLCNGVSYGMMILCDNDGCKYEWFHLPCVDLKEIPARTTKWYCPECRKLLGIGEKGEVSARGVRA